MATKKKTPAKSTTTKKTAKATATKGTKKTPAKPAAKKATPAKGKAADKKETAKTERGPSALQLQALGVLAKSKGGMTRAQISDVDDCECCHR